MCLEAIGAPLIALVAPARKHTHGGR
jgi:hypothetical protein